MAYRGPPQYPNQVYVPAFPVYWSQSEHPQFRPGHSASASLAGRQDRQNCYANGAGLLGDAPQFNFQLPPFPNPQFLAPLNIRNFFPSHPRTTFHGPSLTAPRFFMDNSHSAGKFSPRNLSPSTSPKPKNSVHFSSSPDGSTDEKSRISEDNIDFNSEGTRPSSDSPTSTQEPKLEDKNSGKSGESETVRESADTPINSLSRLCRFNRISPIYELVDEKGPAHLKVFTAKVTLIISGKSEEYFGEGNSIKKAQHDAASRALRSSNLREIPGGKSRQRLDLASSVQSTPVARLNALAIKMRSWAEYQDSSTSTFAASDSFFGGNFFYTKVSVYGKSFTGFGPTKTAARNMAAQSALDFFELEKERKDAKKLEMAAAQAAAPARTSTNSTKAPVSALYEEARRFRLNVAFECSLSDGLPHCQTHHVICKVGTLESAGEGPSKKDARHDAAEKMLQKFREFLGDFAQEPAGFDRRKTANSVKLTKARPDYGKNINPVSRLYQLQQARNQPDPLFEMENPSDRTKDFIVTARVPGGPTVTGLGPNKKLAKRFAAENLMRELGFQVPPPTPLKSSIRLSKPEVVATEDRRVTFDLLNPECDDKTNGRVYRKRFSKKPQPASMYPKNSVQEILFEAKPTPMRAGREITPGLLSLPENESAVLKIGTISLIAREFMTDRHSPTAARILAETRKSDEIEEEEPKIKDAWLPLLQFLCRVVNMTLKKDTFSRQGPHSQFVTVLTVGEPIESIGCGNGATEEKAVEDAAWNLLTVIGEQGDENDRILQEISPIS